MSNGPERRSRNALKFVHEGGTEWCDDGRDGAIEPTLRELSGRCT